MREFRTSGSVEGAVGNHRPYSPPTNPDQARSAASICEPLQGPVYDPCCAEGPVQHCVPVALETSPQLVTRMLHGHSRVERSLTRTRLLRVRPPEGIPDGR